MLCLDQENYLQADRVRLQISFVWQGERVAVIHAYDCSGILASSISLEIKQSPKGERNGPDCVWTCSVEFLLVPSLQASWIIFGRFQSAIIFRRLHVHQISPLVIFFRYRYKAIMVWPIYLAPRIMFPNSSSNLTQGVYRRWECQHFTYLLHFGSQI